MIKASFDLGNSKAMEEIIKKKNIEIAALKKQLNFHATEDPQAKELGETELQKEEILKILVEQSAQIKGMETNMDKLVKEKEQSSQLAVVPLGAVPISYLLQTGIPTTTTIVGTSSSAIPPSSTVDDPIKSTQSLENMSI